MHIEQTKLSNFDKMQLFIYDLILTQKNNTCMFACY